MADLLPKACQIAATIFTFVKHNWKEVTAVILALYLVVVFHLGRYDESENDEPVVNIKRGTDDDLPPTHQNRIPRGGRLAGNGRSAVGSLPYPSRMEWRQAGGHQPGMPITTPALHDSNPTLTVSASRKKQKITPSVPSRSFGGPSPPFPLKQRLHLPAISFFFWKTRTCSWIKGEEA
ncbi:unnamed protein product [Lupinus luteus]|uniref:Uncharacterized protein n=1 Tax=Lupinus luteus TaxID=3873 RepID=A0AAV1Y4M2_LUPLU